VITNNFFRRYNTISLTNIFLIIVCLLLGLGFALFPAISDDLGYAMSFRDFLKGREPFGFYMVTSNIKAHYLIDNARLCNVVAVLLAPLPRLIQAFVSTISIAYLFFCGIKYAKIQHNLFAISIWVAYLVICFPWIDQMYILDFQINYLWSSALSLFIIIAFVRQAKYSTFFLAFVSFIIGMWHEGFSFPLLISFIAIALLITPLRTLKTGVIIISMAIGFAYLAVSPSFRLTPIPLYGSRMLMVYPFAIPTFVLLAIVLLRRIKINTRIALLLFPALISVALMIYSEKGSRVGSLSIVFSGLCFFLLFPLKRKKDLAGISIFFLIILHLFAVVHQAYKANADTSFVLNQYAKHPDKTIYSNMVLRENAPWYCLQKPYYGWFAHSSTISVFERFYGDGTHQILVVPQPLKSFSIENADQIAGDVHAFYINGYIVMPDSFGERQVITYNVDYGRGALYRNFMVVPFKNYHDGKCYSWIYPENTWLNQLTNSKPLSFNSVAE
jgi:hypothetical protein